MQELMIGETKDLVLETTYIDKDFNINKINNKEHEFEYRKSFFNKKQNNIIISTKLKLTKKNQDEIKQKMEKNLKARKDKQPLNLPSAGSVFKRTNEYIPAKIIDECGLKGYNINDAYVSEIHSGFIVNKGKAKAKDIIELINIIKLKVKEKFNIDIETEIEIIGED